MGSFYLSVMINSGRVEILSLLAVLLAIFSTGGVEAQSRGGDKVVVKTIIHNDGSRTDSRRNPSARVLEEHTYGRRNLLLSRRVFEVDEAGRALRGAIFDGKKNLIGRVLFGFDPFGRMTEERTFDMQNRVIRRLIFRYDKEGNRLKPLVYNYAGGISNPKPVEDENAQSTIRTPGVNGGTLGAGERVQPGGVTVPSTPLNQRPGAR